MTWDRDDFRTWLASHEGEEMIFTDSECPLRLWRRREYGQDFSNSAVMFKAEWCRRFVRAVDPPCGGEWSQLSAKDALKILDDLDVSG